MKEMTNTPQQLWRTDFGNQPSSTTVEGAHENDGRLERHEGAKRADGEWSPSPAWRAAFKAQLTPDMMDDVEAYAAKRASWIERATGIHDPGRVSELVQNALGDTFAGVVAWEPMRCPLALHMKSVIRGRVSHELERAEEYRHIAIGQATEHEISDAMALNAAPSGSSEIDDYADDFMARLRVMAEDDRSVLRLLDLYDEGITQRGEMCRVGKMSKGTYHNAHRRLLRLVENLPHNLVTAAIAAMA